MAEHRLAVIPARAGSKRVPGKNVRPLLGRPLMAYTVEAAVESGLFTQVVVSTDSEEVAHIAVQCGAEVPFLRSPALADDHTAVSLATLSVLEGLDARGERYTAVCQLMPNCPLRTADDIQRSFDRFESSGAEAQISVTRFGWCNPWWAVRCNESGKLEPLFAEAWTRRSQDLPDLFCPTGAIWWASADALRRARTFHLPGWSGFELPWQKAVDIDVEEDWELAALLLAASEAHHA